MKVTSTNFEGLLILDPSVYKDERGHFLEAYTEKTLIQNGITARFIQDNQSHSGFGVIRGLHFQREPHAQTKLVRVLSGRILDVVVDLRKSQATFGKVYSIELSSENFRQLLIPPGFAHGFSVLSSEADILYKIDAYYHPESEGGIFCNDPDLGIDWGLGKHVPLISAKDRGLPMAKDLEQL